MTMPVFEQVDPVLCEDGKTVMLHGFEHDETCWMAIIDLPMAVSEEAFEAELGAWRDVRNVQWRCTQELRG